MDYRSRWQQKRRVRATRTRLIAIVAVILAGTLVTFAWRGLARREPAAFALAEPDVCWLTPTAEGVLMTARSGRIANLTPDLEQQENWSRHFSHPAGFWGPAAVLDGLALVGCEDVRLRAVDLATGLQAWELRTQAGVPGVATSEELAWFTSEDGWLHCATATGELVWETQVGRKVTTAALVTDDLVIVGTADGTVDCVAREDGAALWTVELGAPVNAEPRMGPSTVLVGDDSGALHSITRDGELLASLELEGLIRAPVAVSGPIVIAADTSGTVARVDASEMSLMWTVRLPGAILAEPAIVGDSVWCGAGRHLIELNVDSGRVLSRHVAEAQTCDVLAAHGRIYWATTDGRVRAISPGG